MATSDFLPFAGANGANVITQAAYAGSTQQTTGFQSGIAPSSSVNKPIRQSAIMAAVLAQFIADQTGVNSVDDGTTATLLANLKKSMPGRLLRTSIYTLVSGVQNVSIDGAANTTTGASTFTPFSTATKWRVRVLGGGAGGGGAAAAAASQVSCGSGGGAGGYSEGIFTALSGSYAVTVGAGGNGGVGAAVGGSGASSSLGSVATATGGTGGNYGLSGTSCVTATASGGVGSGGQITCNGGSSNPAFCLFSFASSVSSAGGSSFFGAGGSGFATVSTVTGQNARSYGAAGGGAASFAGNAAATGGTGMAGIVIVEEFA